MSSMAVIVKQTHCQLPSQIKGEWQDAINVLEGFRKSKRDIQTTVKVNHSKHSTVKVVVGKSAMEFNRKFRKSMETNPPK